MTLHVLSALLNDKHLKNLSKLDSRFFLQEEIGSFNFIEKYAAKYNSLPNIQTCRKEGFHLPETFEGFEYYLDITKQRYIRTMLSNALHPENVQRLLEKDPNDAIDSLDLLKSNLEGIYKSKELTDIFEGSEDVEAFMHQSLCGQVMGISTGSPVLDALIHGFKGSDFMTLFARPGVGKTYLLLAFAKATLAQGKRGLFINTEMSDLQVQQRFWASIMGLNTDAMYEGNILTEHFQKMKAKKEEYKSIGSNLHVVNPEKRLTISRLKSYILETKPDIVFIDSAYLLNPDPATFKASSGSLDRLNVVVEDIRNLAKHLDIPIVAVAQANRSSVGKKSADTTAVGGTDFWSQMSSVMIHLEKHDTEDKYLIGTLVKNREGRTTENGKPIQFLIDNDFDHMIFGVNRRIGKDELDTDKEDTKGNVTWY
jgi:replicative DNA helicase